MEHIILHPIGIVSNDRKLISDDNWGEVESVINLRDGIPEEALTGLLEFSHIHVVFYFDKVEDAKICLEARHPRNNTSLPKIGIFAQRAKNRPNKIGITVCKLLSIEKNKITVVGLDAIDGTPVLDIKPYLVEFDVRDNIQPDWTRDIMKNYF
ncbi:MAG: tRNA (N6-threonylcarbamoyladenosine(37)-N6)-methyltransferase TrmO [Ignavibacteriae bacterium]|nr:tRNA (N6-threonylcarbamoyladenosine(37)-N6)-methyltransferase TrmO [Ignavibacteriota bacterium]